MASVKTITVAYLTKAELDAYQNETTGEDPLSEILELEQLALDNGFKNVHDLILIVRLTRNSGEYDG